MRPQGPPHVARLGEEVPPLALKSRRPKASSLKAMGLTPKRPPQGRDESEDGSTGQDAGRSVPAGRPGGQGPGSGLPHARPVDAAAAPFRMPAASAAAAPPAPAINS